MQAQHLLEREFAREGTRIQWLVVDGAGPAQNEAIANGLVDFANFGILPNIIGPGGGLKTRIIASYGYANTYLIARPDLPIRAARDLKGHTIGVDVGHVPHLAVMRLLAENGMANPLPTVRYVARVRRAADFSLQQKLVRQPVPMTGWVDVRPIVAAAKERGVFTCWPH